MVAKIQKIKQLACFYPKTIALFTKNKRFFSNFSTKPHILYEGAIFLRKFNIKN